MSFGPWFFKAITPLVILQICILSGGSSSSSRTDFIASLPKQPSVNFKQYAGYISVGDDQERALFYYFVEAENDPQNKPLVLWLNGGPGCSSVAGAFYGHGPFTMTGEDLIINNFSRNKESNILFLDSPAGTGFSYSQDKSFYSTRNDENTAHDNLKFILGWLGQYPEYKNRDFFITGVSFAGHFVPQLAELVLQTELKSNFKGIAIGNPVLDFDSGVNSWAVYLWSHGLISDSTYSMLSSVCNMSRILKGFRDGKNSSSCLQVYNQAIGEISAFVSLEHVLMDVCISSVTSQDEKPDSTENVPDVCVANEITKYFNREDVQKAFHAKLVGVDQWKLCFSTYNQQDIWMPTIPLIGELVKAGVRVMVFSGDQDVLSPFMLTRTMLDTLAKDLGLGTTVAYRSWMEDKQVGGWTQIYGNGNLSFATVRGGGHESVGMQPKRTAAVFNSFLRGVPLPPPN